MVLSFDKIVTSRKIGVTIYMDTTQPTTQVPQEIVSNPQETIEPQTEPIKETLSTQTGPEIVDKPIEGEVIEKHPGQPTKYNERMLKIAQDYYLLCNGETDGKRRMPLLEELARFCEVNTDTVNQWVIVHNEFSVAVKRIKELQKESIIKRGFSMKNPTFAIFMLKANHDMIETEKRILAGERNSEPVQMNIMNYNKPQDQLPPQAVAQLDELANE